MQQATQRLHRMDNDLKTDITVEANEPFCVDLLNAYGKKFLHADEMEHHFLPMNNAHKRSLSHPCTGPIELAGNHLDSSLEITVLHISVTRAYQCLSKSSGLLKDRIKNRRHCQIFDVCDQDSVLFSEGLRLKTAPSLGFISTFDDNIISCGRATQNGGNIDLNFLRKGSRITLPINGSVARLAVGDLHLLQGNGEASGTGIEADGYVILSMKAVKKIPYPVIEDQDILCVVGWGNTIEECLKKGVNNSIAYLKQHHFPHLDFAPLYKFVSVASNMVIGNASGKTKTCGIVFNRNQISGGI